MPETEKKLRNVSISQLRNDIVILLQQTKHLQARVFVLILIHFYLCHCYSLSFPNVILSFFECCCCVSC